MKHPHADLMKAYADDCTLQVQVKTYNGWVDVNGQPAFHKLAKYRVKPKDMKVVHDGRSTRAK